MNLKAYTYTLQPLKKSKKIYIDDNIEIHTTCPECKQNIIYDNCVPFLRNNFDGTFYNHVLYCDHCEYESDEKLYTLTSVNEYSVDVEFNPIFNVTVYEKVLQKKES